MFVCVTEKVAQLVSSWHRNELTLCDLLHVMHLSVHLCPLHLATSSKCTHYFGGTNGFSNISYYCATFMVGVLMHMAS